MTANRDVQAAHRTPVLRRVRECAGRQRLPALLTPCDVNACARAAEGVPAPIRPQDASRALFGHQAASNPDPAQAV